MAGRKNAFRILQLLALALFVVACGGDGGGGGGPTPPPPLPSSAALVNLGDAAPDRVLAVSFRITSITLNQTAGGGSANLLQSPGGLLVELTHLRGEFEPVSVNVGNLIPGTYISATINMTPGAVTFVDDLGVIRQDAAADLTSSSVTLNLPSSVVVGFTNIQPTVLSLEFLPSSIAINTTTNEVTINPTFNVTALLIDGSTPQTPTTGGIEDVSGVVSAVSGTSFTMNVSQAAVPLTFNTGTGTQYTGGLSGFGGIAVNNVLEVDAVTQADGTRLATVVDGEVSGAGATTGGAITGIITSVTLSLVLPNPVTAFNMTVHDSASTAAVPSVGNTLNVTDLTGITTYIVDAQGTDLANLPFTAVFDATSIRAMQEVEAIYTNAAVTTAPVKLKLKRQGINGTIGNVVAGPGGQQTFELNLPADSAFRLLTGVATIFVVRQPTTQMVGGATVTPGNAVSVTGMLFFDKPSGRYYFVAARIAP